MSRWRNSLLCLGAAALLTGCVTTPKRNLDLERIQATLAQLESDPVLGPLAPAEVARARQAVRALAETTSGSEAVRAHLAYLAERRVDIAQATAQAAQEESKIAQLDREHDQILIDANRRDATLARLEAEKLRVQSLARAEEAERANQATAVAIAASEQSALDAEQARAAAEQAKRVAAAQSQEAELAKRETELALAAADSLRVQMQNLKARRDQRGEVMTLGESVFRAGKATLESEAVANLDRVVEFVGRDPNRRIRIEGHTDNRGGANLNQVLSQKRAEAVRDALIAKGVDAARVQAVGMGSGVPVAPNDSEAGRARNRRVEVILEGPG
jgi:outer membrane protein OmpA-like peptidoglycan-associated protein